jgi:hypothetical protein
MGLQTQDNALIITHVVNLATGEERIYWCDPFSALVSCYAQEELHDFNTWTYAKYFLLVDYTSHTYLLGDWSVLHGQ